MRKLVLATLTIALTATVSACGSASATSRSAGRPDLIVPPPPPKVVEPTPEPTVEPLPEPPAPATSPSTTPATRTGRGTREVTKPQVTEAKPEAKAEEPPPPAPVAAPPAPAPQLRTAESTGAEGAVRATIDRTRQLLETIDYRRLSSARRRAYDDAKRFAQQAEEALKAGNTVFAQGVAGKGETLARELAGK